MTVGGPLTVKAAVATPTPPSGLITVTLREPSVAVEEIVRFAVSEVELVKETELTVTPAPPNETDAPLTKFAPVIVTS